MAKHKLISYYLKTEDNVAVKVTLLKQAAGYSLRCEYFKDDDKIKETNTEVERNFVYQLFCNLEIIDLKPDEDNKCNEFGCLRIYYGSHDYLEYYLSKEIINNCKELRTVLISLLDFVDNNICSINL